ncbi:hypothetical protein [Kaistella soli]|nr:hypothetical protein [Kaistella soli]
MKFTKTITYGEPFFIQDINIWTQEWKSTGEKIDVKDPIYHR